VNSSTPPGPGEAQTEYTRRHQLLSAETKHWQKRERLLSRLRLGVFLVAAILTWLFFGSQQISGWWPLVAALCFVGLLIFHDRVIHKKARALRADQFYERCLSRLRGEWVGKGDAGLDYSDPHHPYCEDLDIFGTGSLFELLATVRTSAGRDVLASWLCAPAETETIRERQVAVEELRGHLDLREDLAILGEDVELRFTPSALVKWASDPPAFEIRKGSAALAAILSASSTLSLLAWILGSLGTIYLVVPIALQTGLALFWRKRAKATLAAVERPCQDLGILRDLLHRIEEEHFTSPPLVEKKEALESKGRAPSAQIAHLDRLQQFLDARRNQFFAPFGALLLFGTQIAFAIEAWRQANGPLIASWIDAGGEIEALCALSCFAYENPEDCFPQFVSNTEGPLLDGSGLGHPLLPAHQAVRNDVSLDAATRALIVSGSNMSGKSTLLRTVGTNLVLAHAGAPVRAESLRVSSLCIGASIRVMDSLQDGTSRFYAEILRLRQLLDLSGGDRTLVFLLDEILHGTNSHDRQHGAQAVIRSLLARQAIGIVTTHDLALAQIAEDPSLGILNVHFEDSIRDSRIEFDYRLHPGVVRHSNALDLMRAAGLDV
jgi:hypothetical protein